MYMYKSARIDLRLSPKEIEILDQKRGATTRSGFIRWLIEHHDTKAGHPHPDPVVPPLDPTPAPVPNPITPPVPPPNPVETFTPPIPWCDHDWVKAGGMFNRCTICDERMRR